MIVERRILILSPPHVLLKAWAPALMEELAVSVPHFSLPSISKSSWDAPRAKISSCLLHWDSQTSNIGKEVAAEVPCHGSQAAWGVLHMSLLFLGSCSAREAAGRDHALALSKAPDFWKCLPASRVHLSSQEIWEIGSQGIWLLKKR